MRFRNQSIMCGFTPISGACSMMRCCRPSSRSRTVTFAVERSRIVQSMGMGAGMVHLVMTASPSKGAGSLAGERVKEPPTPQPHCQQRPEQNQGVDALAPLSCPIHVLQSKPERELIQGQRGADAVEERREARRPVQGATDPGADLREPDSDATTVDSLNDLAEDNDGGTGTKGNRSAGGQTHSATVRGSRSPSTRRPRRPRSCRRTSITWHVSSVRIRRPCLRSFLPTE